MRMNSERVMLTSAAVKAEDPVVSTAMQTVMRWLDAQMPTKPPVAEPLRSI